jgi:hypothetical protein
VRALRALQSARARIHGFIFYANGLVGQYGAERRDKVVRYPMASVSPAHAG